MERERRRREGGGGGGDGKDGRGSTKMGKKHSRQIYALTFFSISS